MDVKFPNIEVQLSGQDGNAFAIIGAVARGIGSAPVGDFEVFETREERAAAKDEWNAFAMASDSYDQLLQRAMSTVNVL